MSIMHSGNTCSTRRGGGGGGHFLLECSTSIYTTATIANHYYSQYLVAQGGAISFLSAVQAFTPQQPLLIIIIASIW